MISRALVLVVVAFLGGCLGRAEDLIADTNARVIVTGAAAGDELSLEVSGERRDLVALDEEPITIYLALEDGSHEGLVRLETEPPRCARFVLRVDDGAAPAIASVDLRGAAACEAPHDGGADDDDDDAGDPDDAGLTDGGEDGGVPDDDAGFDAGPQPGDGGVDSGPPAEVFVHLAESVSVDPCLEVLCLQVTRAEADGTVAWADLGLAEVSGQVSAADVEALAAATLSAEANALFAGDDPACAQPRPVALLPIVLERSYRPAGASDAVVETVGVAGCSGIAEQLRARLAFLRQLALDL